MYVLPFCSNTKPMNQKNIKDPIVLSNIPSKIMDSKTEIHLLLC